MGQSMPMILPTSAPPDYVSETLACRYDNTFSGFSECKEYRGMWLREDIEVDCGEVLSGVSGEISAERCERDAALGTCEVEVSAITSTSDVLLRGRPRGHCEHVR